MSNFKFEKPITRVQAYEHDWIWAKVIDPHYKPKSEQDTIFADYGQIACRIEQSHGWQRWCEIAVQLASEALESND